MGAAKVENPLPRFDGTEFGNQHVSHSNSLLEDGLHPQLQFDEILLIYRKIRICSDQLPGFEP